MKIGIRCSGVGGELVHAQLEALTQLCGRLYAERRELPRVDHSGVTYRPDPPSDEIVLEAPDVWGTSISCGSAAAAYAGWQRSRGAPWQVRADMVAPGVWHAYAYIYDLPSAHRRVWDPMKELRR
jgi:hypothetical protein